MLYRNLLAVWCFAAAVTLPMPLTAAVIILGASAEWPSLKISSQALPYRYVYSTAGAILAALTAHECAALPVPHGLAVALAAPSYMAAGLLAVIAAQFAVGQRRNFESFLRWNAHRLEVITLLIGLAEATMIEAHQQLALWVSLPIAIALQRRAVWTDLRNADNPTSAPMAEQAWVMVAREVIRACPVGAIMRINTTDPAAVSYLARVKAGCDAIGMTGRSGLAVLLTQCPGENADALADRMRSILLRDGVTAQVAVAAKPRDGHSLDDLLAVSEAELIARVAATRSARLDMPEA